MRLVQLFTVVIVDVLFSWSSESDDKRLAQAFGLFVVLIREMCTSTRTISHPAWETDTKKSVCWICIEYTIALYEYNHWNRMSWFIGNATQRNRIEATEIDDDLITTHRKHIQTNQHHTTHSALQSRTKFKKKMVLRWNNGDVLYGTHYILKQIRQSAVIVDAIVVVVVAGIVITIVLMNWPYRWKCIAEFIRKSNWTANVRYTHTAHYAYTNIGLIQYIKTIDEIWL